jgi:hypothetical protein
MPPRAQRLLVGAVLVGDRYRTDLGDLTELMRSMANEGQLHPICVLDNHELLYGERRLESARRLGWTEIDAITVTTVTEAVEAIAADRATFNGAGYCLPMKISERVAMLEPLYALKSRDPGYLSRKIDLLAAHTIGVGATRYREIRTAVLIAHGRRPRMARGVKPVSDLERNLAAIALSEIDGGGSAEAVLNRLRAQLGYVPKKHVPTLPVNPHRLTLAGTRRANKAPRKPLLPQLDSAIHQLLRAVDRLDKLVGDDRWNTNEANIAVGTRTGIAQAVGRLTTINSKVNPGLEPEHGHGPERPTPRRKSK